LTRAVATDGIDVDMSHAAKLLRDEMRRVIIAQGLLVAATAALFGYWQGGTAMLAALYGGAIACLNTLLMARRVGRSAEAARPDQGQGTIHLYLGILQRFGIALAGFALGIGWLQLPPLPQLAAFAAAQFGYLAVGLQRT